MSAPRPLLPPGSVISYADMTATVVRDDGLTLIVDTEGERMKWAWHFDGETCQVVSVPGAEDRDTPAAMLLRVIDLKLAPAIQRRELTLEEYQTIRAALEWLAEAPEPERGEFLAHRQTEPHK